MWSTESSVLCVFILGRVQLFFLFFLFFPQGHTMAYIRHSGSHGRTRRWGHTWGGGLQQQGFSLQGNLATQLQ